MSGFSESTECPNCGKDCDVYCDRKPFDYYRYDCYHCGLSIYPFTYYSSLKELNINRKEQGLKKLKKLPKQDKNLW